MRLVARSRRFALKGSALCLFLLCLLVVCGCSPVSRENSGSPQPKQRTLKEEYKAICRLIPPGTRIREVSQRMGGDGMLTIERIGSNDVCGWEYWLNQSRGFHITFDTTPLDTNWSDARSVNVAILMRNNNSEAAKVTP